MKMLLRWTTLLSLVLSFLTGCETINQQDMAAREAMNAAIRQEAPGNYFIGRRLYKKDFKMWGWVREPGKPWSTAQLVMLNEQKKLAPDRERGKLGDDNNYEYKLFGYFSGDMVYEPASNRFYPEFVLTGYELRSIAPPPIYRNPKAIDPAARILTPPY